MIPLSGQLPSYVLIAVHHMHNKKKILYLRDVFDASIVTFGPPMICSPKALPAPPAFDPNKSTTKSK